MSIVRGHVMRRGSISSVFPCVEMIVEHRRQQIVRRGNRVKIAGEVEVDVLHRHDLRVAAARRPALHAEHRSHARLAHAEDGVLAEPTHRLREPDERGALPLAGGGRIDTGDEHEAPFRGALRHLEIDFGLVLPVQIELVRVQTKIGGDVHDRAKLGVLCDLNIRRYGCHAQLRDDEEIGELR